MMQLLEQNEQDVIDRYNSGESISGIGKYYKVNSGSVWYFLEEKVGVKRTRSDKYGKIENYKDDLLALSQEGYSAYKIHKIIGISKPTTLRWLKRLGVDTSKYSTQKKKANLDEKLICDLYKGGKSTNGLATKFDTNSGTIWKILKKHNIKCRDKTIYSVDETFFDTIDTAEKAYVLGWWYSDGNVMPSGKIRIAIQQEDREILETIKQIMQFTGPIRDIAPRKEFPHRKWQCLLNIDRKRLADALIDKGCIPNKSLIVKWPDFSIVPKNLIKSFILGYFDGDGSWGSEHHRCVMIVGSIDFINGLQSYLKNELDIDSAIYIKRKSAQLYFGKKTEVIKFQDWLYKDTDLYLKRKYDLVHNSV